MAYACRSGQLNGTGLISHAFAAVWAMDISDVPNLIDGVSRHVFAVRDLG